MRQSSAAVVHVDFGGGIQSSVPDSDSVREELTDKNWKTYAARHYANPQMIGDEELDQDVKRLKYVKKAITRYRTTGDICERLILNHMIVLCNVFGPVHACRLMFLKMEDQLDVLKPFMVMLRMLPSRVTVAGKSWNTDEIPMDDFVVGALRKI